MRSLVLLGLIGCVFAGAASAQAPADNIVVKGSRIADFENDLIPHVHLVRRADALSVRYDVVCDTRDPRLRETELRATLRNLVRAAQRDSAVEIGITVEYNDFGDEAVVDFDETMIESLPLQAGRRSDVSQVTISLWTEIAPSDTLDSLDGRLTRFVEAVRLEGRTEILQTGNHDLTVIGGPGRYRDELLSAIAADAGRVAGSFGEGFSAEISGLEGSVRWQRSGVLALSLYIDYALAVDQE